MNILKKIVLYLVYTFWYFNWSKVYQFFQYRSIPKENRKLIEESLNKVKNGNHEHYRDLWHNLCKPLSWNADGRKELWDAIQHPVYFLYCTLGDCEDFARLGYEVFGNAIPDLNYYYTFDGYYFIVKNKLYNGGHAIAVWKSAYGNYLIVSNKQIYRFTRTGLIENVFEFYGDKEFFLSICDAKGKVKKIYTAEEYRRGED